MERKQYFHPDPTANNAINSAMEGRTKKISRSSLTADEIRAVPIQQRAGIIASHKNRLSTAVRIGLIYEARKERKALKRR